MNNEPTVPTPNPAPAAFAPGGDVQAGAVQTGTVQAGAGGTPAEIAARTGVTLPTTPLIASHKATPGERLYKAVVHVGINTVLNEVIGLGFMWAGEFGKGKGALLDGVWNMTNKVKPFVTNRLVSAGLHANTARGVANEGVNILLLTMGGNSLLVPIKLIENQKLDLVKKADAMLDRMHGRTELGAQEKADREAAYARIEQEVKPTWGRVLAARSSAVLYNSAMFGLWKSLDKNPDQERRGASRVTHWLAEIKGSQNLEKALTGKMTPPNIVANHATWPWWIRGVALETMSTLHCSAAFFAKYELFDRRKEKKILAEKIAAEAASNGGSVAGSNAGTNEATYRTSEVLYKAGMIPQGADGQKTEAQKEAETLATNPPDIIMMTAAVPNAAMSQPMSEKSAAAHPAIPSTDASKELALQAIAQSSPESTPAAAAATSRVAPRGKTESRGESYAGAATREAEQLANAGHAMGA